MAILEGTTADGALVPVQVTDQGRVVAEGLTGPQGPEGPQGPPGPDSPVWDRNGTVVSPTNDGDSLELTSGDTAGVSLDPGSTGWPMARDSSGRLGVGIATPGSRLHVYDGPSGGTPNVNARTVIEDNNNAYLNLLVPNTHNCGIYLGDEDKADVCYINYRHSTDTLMFGVNGAEVSRFTSSGVFRVGNPGSTNIPPAVSLDPGSTGSPLVRDSAGRLLVGIDSAPAGTLAGDVVCQGAVVLQSPNGTWWAIEVANDGTLSVAQTSVR